MSKLGRVLGTFALVILTVPFVPSAAEAQVSAVKDGWLVLKIHSEFVDEDVLDGSNIDVDVDKGVVTLQGTVPSEAARARALQAARDNDGVKSVTDELRIAPASRDRGTADRTRDKAAKTADQAEDKIDRAGDKTETTAKRSGRAVDDGWIKSKIYAQYMADWNTVLDDSDIDIDVDNNMVTLSGVVKSAAAKTKAVSIAKGTDGVKGVKDNLRVSSSQ